MQNQSKEAFSKAQLQFLPSENLFREERETANGKVSLLFPIAGFGLLAVVTVHYPPRPAFAWLTLSDDNKALPEEWRAKGGQRADYCYAGD